MSALFSPRGSNDLSRTLEEIQEGMSLLTGEQHVSIDELLTDDFIVENTNFDRAASFFRAANVKGERHLDEKSFDDFVKAHTRFADWREMLVESSNRHAARFIQAGEEEDKTI